MKAPSYICSKYYNWFKQLGYDRLDINKYSDGSWDIIEFQTVPLIPSQTMYRTILGNMKNIEISYGFVQKYVDEIDLTKKQIWAREEKRTQKMLDEKDAQERAAYDRSDQAFKAMRYNPDLMERIVKNGLGEMNIDKIARHVPRVELEAQKKSYNAQI